MPIQGSVLLQNSLYPPLYKHADPKALPWRFSSKFLSKNDEAIESISNGDLGEHNNETRI